MKKIVIEVEVSEPEVVGDGILKTKLTHPLLNGSLSVVHGTKNAEATLQALKVKAEGDDVLCSFTELVDAFFNKSKK